MTEILKAILETDKKERLNLAKAKEKRRSAPELAEKKAAEFTKEELAKADIRIENAKSAIKAETDRKIKLINDNQKRTVEYLSKHKSEIISRCADAAVNNII
ncbi:hypothetical protein LJB90_00365 [Eubacteriales bacterium OttesenSCG-928-G02]|nr:hypothetical protein [Eubacteriales bacterium OttesenSCG-928-G02]